MQFWIWLNQLKGLSLAKKKELLLKHKSPEGVWCALKNLNALSEDALDLSPALKIIENHTRLNIKTLTLYEAREVNRNAYHEKWPIVCYYIGKLIHGLYTSVIGTRNYSIMGFHYTEQICKRLSEDKRILVTGLSLGIETLAIRKCMGFKGALLVFSTCGLDRCYPSENNFIFNKVKMHYGILSLYPCHTPTFKSHFSETNFFMTLWSNEVILVEASEKSGAYKSAKSVKLLDRDLRVVYDGRCSNRNAGNMILLDNKIGFAYNVKLPESLERLMQHPLLIMIKDKPCSIEKLLAQQKSSRQKIIEDLIELELHRLILFKADGRWHYNGW